MSAARRLAVAAAMLAALTVGACGDGGEDSTQTVAPTPPAVLERVEATCRDFRRETKAVGKGALADPPDTTFELTTERLVKPSIPLLESAARRMQALAPKVDDPLFDLYADLFDPAIVLAEQRLAAGRAGNEAEAKRLEDALGNIGLEQRRAAGLLDLPACAVNFQSVLLASLTE